jgi:hypothetical protein
VSFLNRVSRFAKSPQGRRVMDQAMRVAKDPETRRKLADARRRLGAGRKPPR